MTEVDWLDRLEPCTHPAPKRKAGPRVPLVYGTCVTEVCECGGWRTMHGRPGPWRSAIELQAALERETEH